MSSAVIQAVPTPLERELSIHRKDCPSCGEALPDGTQGIAFFRGEHVHTDCAVKERDRARRLRDAAPQMYEACKAAAAYHDAINHIAVEGKSWVTNDELDALFNAWASATDAALALIDDPKEAAP